jgi:hypothetical protein
VALLDDNGAKLSLLDLQSESMVMMVMVVVM